MKRDFPTKRRLALTAIGFALAGIVFLWVAVTASNIVPRVAGWVAGLCFLAVGAFGLWGVTQYDSVQRRK